MARRITAKARAASRRNLVKARRKRGGSLRKNWKKASPAAKKGFAKKIATTAIVGAAIGSYAGAAINKKREKRIVRSMKSYERTLRRYTG